MKAVIYCRVSSTKQEDGTSLDSQLEACRAHAKKLGYTVVKSVREIYSGADFFDRPQLGQVRDEIKQGKYDAFFVYHTDRLSRGGIAHLAILVDEFGRYGCEIVSVTDPLDKSDEGELIRSVNAYAAKKERLQIRERTMRGRHHAAVKGTLAFGRPLYGYEVNESGRRYIDETEAGWVRYIFQSILDGTSLRRLATDLNGRGVPTTQGSIWWPHTVKKLVNNPAYCGRTIVFRYKHKVFFDKGVKKHNGSALGDPENQIELPDATPAIVSKRDWEEAQIAMQVRSKARITADSPEYLLRGFVRCATCGRSFSPVGKHKLRYYVCTSTQNPSVNCHTKSFPAVKAEENVWNFVCEIIRNTDYKPEIGRSSGDPLEAIDKQISRLTGEIERIVKRSATADDTTWLLFEKEILVKKGELGRVNQRREEILKKTNKNRKTESVPAIRKRFGKNLNKLTFEQRVALLTALGLSCTWDGTTLHTTINATR
jgi:site-specific DNA recombinase